MSLGKYTYSVVKEFGDGMILQIYREVSCRIHILRHPYSQRHVTNRSIPRYCLPHMRWA